MNRCDQVFLVLILLLFNHTWCIQARTAPGLTPNCFQPAVLESPNHNDVFRSFARCISEAVRHMAVDFQRRELTRATKNAVIAMRGRRSGDPFGDQGEILEQMEDVGFPRTKAKESVRTWTRRNKIRPSQHILAQ